jgi:hypothetical protein
VAQVKTLHFSAREKVHWLFRVVQVMAVIFFRVWNMKALDFLRVIKSVDFSAWRR